MAFDGSFTKILSVCTTDPKNISWEFDKDIITYSWDILERDTQTDTQTDAGKNIITHLIRQAIINTYHLPSFISWSTWVVSSLSIIMIILYSQICVFQFVIKLICFKHLQYCRQLKMLSLERRRNSLLKEKLQANVCQSFEFIGKFVLLRLAIISPLLQYK